MLRLSRLILCVLIVISLFYKSMCSLEEIRNDNTNVNSKDLDHLVELANLMYNNNGDTSDTEIHRGIRLWRSVVQGSGYDRKRSTNDVNDAYKQFYDELLKVPLQNWDLRKLEKYPRIKNLIIRLLCNLKDKRNLISDPGREVQNDDCIEIQRYRPQYAPRLGKKSDDFSPRLGKQCSETVDRKK